MAKKKTNATTESSENNGYNGHVSVPRDEYNAWRALEERNADIVAQEARVSQRNHDLRITCEAQARRLVEVDMLTRNLERTNEVQRVFIEALRADHPKVAALEDLSEFWRQWLISVGDPKRSPRVSPETLTKFEPDLFRSWSLWMREAGRTFSMAGTRTEVDASLPTTQAELQHDIAHQFREKNLELEVQLRKLEEEIEKYKSDKTAAKTKSW